MCQRCSKEGEGGSRELSVSGGCLCALSGRRGVARCNGQEPRQPSSKVNSTASLCSPGLCLFCPLQAPPETCWQAAAWRCAPALQAGWQALLCVCLCCCPAAAAIALLGCCSRPCFQQKSHMRFSHACCCRELWSRNLGDWEIASRDPAFLSQAPSSLTEIRCVLCVRKN